MAVSVISDEGFNCHCSIVLAKCKLTLIQRVTVPRLELKAATLLIKHDQVLRRELRLNQVSSHFWTDSTIVLRYIRNESRAFKTYVSNRVALIRGKSDVSQWRFVTGSVNLADMITRVVTASELLKVLHLAAWTAVPDKLYAVAKTTRFS